LVHEPNDPDQVDAELRDPVGLRGADANDLGGTLGIIGVTNAVELGGPKGIGWVADVS
tara:strand:+ start:228 stop:401 length:174 start_codon:yes stop_codon:yes gene_type:complete